MVGHLHSGTQLCHHYPTHPQRRMESDGKKMVLQSRTISEIKTRNNNNYYIQFREHFTESRRFRSWAPF